MRAAVVSGDRSIALASVAAPDCGPEQIRVRVEACGLCGSDLHAARRRSWPVGLIPGHEIAGRVDAIGAGVADQAAARGLSPGVRVVVEPLSTCGRCACCEDGRDSTCPALAIAGVHRAGGFAELVVAEVARVHRIDPGLEPAIATLIEPLAVALHALDRAGGVDGARVLVLGGGTLGLLCAFAAGRAGALEVALRARYPHQQRLAALFGATALDAARALEEDELVSRFDVVIETVGGASQTLVEAGRTAGPGGRVVVLGLFDRDPPFDPMPALEKELSFAWGNCYHSGIAGDPDFARAARLLATHRETLGQLVTTRYPLEEISTAFTRAGEKRDGIAKLVVLISTEPGPTSRK